MYICIYKYIYIYIYIHIYVITYKDIQGKQPKHCIIHAQGKLPKHLIRNKIGAPNAILIHLLNLLDSLST